MKPAAHAVSIELEVPFHDVDGLRIVWHGHYLKYMELARTALMRSRGLDVRDVLELGYGLLVVETRIRHSFPLYYADKFRVTCWCVDIDNRVHVAYEIHNLTHGRRSARASTKMVTTDPQGNLLYETPHPIVDRLLDPGVRGELG